MKPVTRLKTATESEMIAELKKVLLTDIDGNLITATHDYWVLLMPNLLAPTGKMLLGEDGNEYPEKLPLDGYHANLVTVDSRIIRKLRHITVNVKNKLLKVAGEK